MSTKDVTCRSRNLALNLGAENLDNPRKTRGQAHHQKMCRLPKTTRWPLWPKDGTTTRKKSYALTTVFRHRYRLCWAPYVKERTIVKKMYVCVFTCASSRMVHLELTNSLTTDEFLQSLSRMTNRRGLCHTVWSDNAKTFKAASNEIKKLYSKRETQSQSMWDTLDQNRIES